MRRLAAIVKQEFGNKGADFFVWVDPRDATKRARHPFGYRMSARYDRHDRRRLGRGPGSGSKPGFTTAHSGVQKGSHLP